jgi:hypothetical protein
VDKTEDIFSFSNFSQNNTDRRKLHRFESLGLPRAILPWQLNSDLLFSVFCDEWFPYQAFVHKTKRVPWVFPVNERTASGLLRGLVAGFYQPDPDRPALSKLKPAAPGRYWFPDHQRIAEWVQGRIRQGRDTLFSRAEKEAGIEKIFGTQITPEGYSMLKAYGCERALEILKGASLAH